MATATVPILVRHNEKMIRINANLDWSILQLKQHLYLQCNTKPERLKIIFAGSELPNCLILKKCQLSHGTVVHLVVTATVPDEEEKPLIHHPQIPTNNIAPALHGIATQSESKRERFYVFCKSGNCNAVKCGKLRVCCKLCGDEAFELTRGPSSWKDVMDLDQINGLCNSKNCSGNIAKFFFKCSESSNEENGQHTVIPLSLLRTNIQDVPCLACTSIENTVLVFPCPRSHVICLDCFAMYCHSKLDSRQYVLIETIGYTLCCPGMNELCSDTYIEEIHHFMIAGKSQYERYKNFATEEYLLQNGGIFCPGQGCGNGILTETDARKVVCHRSRGGCGMVFCRRCQLVYHEGECKSNDHQAPVVASNTYTVDHRNAVQAQWRRDTRLTNELIERSTKKCPSCKSSTEKSGGCNHMTCARCQFQWCWICKVEWGRNCEADHWFRAM